MGGLIGDEIADHTELSAIIRRGMMTDIEDRRAAGSDAQTLRAVLGRTSLALTAGITTFFIVAVSSAPLISVLTISILIVGVILVVQYLAAFEKRVENVESVVRRSTDSLSEYGAETQRLVAQRDEESQQISLLIRYVEERIPRVIADTLNFRQKDEPLVRELAHSLNTPLAQIEATLLAARKNETIDGDLLPGLLHGVGFCKSFVAVFRDLATLARDSLAWEPESLAGAVSAAAEMYTTKTGRKASVTVGLPDRVGGYDNNYLVATLLPLLENAIESMPDGGAVRVGSTVEESSVLLEVENTASPAEEISERILEPHFTTKPGHDGLGLSTVQSLLSAHKDAKVSYGSRGDSTVFSVRLPRGKDVADYLAR